MTRPRGAMARRVALSASDRRRVSLTSHEAAGGPVERRVLPAAAVASLDNGALRRVPAARRRPKPMRGRRPASSNRGRVPSFPPRRTGWPYRKRT